MVALNNKRIIRNLIFIVLFLMLVLIIVFIIRSIQYYGNDDVIRLKNINSDTINELFLIKPNNIERVYSQYIGDVSLATMEKSMFNFANYVVPKYKKVFTNQYKNEIDSYYEQNQFAIGVDTGISDIEEFRKLAEGIVLLEGDLKMLSFELLDSTPSKTSNYLITKMYVRYSDNKRIIFKVKISNEKLKNISSIKYSYERIED